MSNLIRRKSSFARAVLASCRLPADEDFDERLLVGYVSFIWANQIKVSAMTLLAPKSIS